MSATVYTLRLLVIHALERTTLCPLARYIGYVLLAMLQVREWDRHETTGQQAHHLPDYEPDARHWTKQADVWMKQAKLGMFDIDWHTCSVDRVDVKSVEETEAHVVVGLLLHSKISKQWRYLKRVNKPSPLPSSPLSSLPRRQRARHHR
jgi:hypothetical protein